MSEFYIPSAIGLDTGVQASASSASLATLLGYTSATKTQGRRSGFYIAAIGSDVYMRGFKFGDNPPTVSSSDYRIKIPQGNGATVIVAKRSLDFSITAAGSFAVQEIE